jgi:rubrerythrin
MIWAESCGIAAQAGGNKGKQTVPCTVLCSGAPARQVPRNTRLPSDLTAEAFGIEAEWRSGLESPVLDSRIQKTTEETMGVKFNIQEVLSMAVRMESNGAAFYRRAAELHQGAGGQYLARLAEMEDAHKQMFTDMRSEYARQQQDGQVFDLYDEGELYLSAIAGGSPVEGSPDIAATLSGHESLADLLRIAVDLEKQAILFYLGIKDVVVGDRGRQTVDRVIGEEQGHVVTLMGELKKIEGAAA